MSPPSRTSSANSREYRRTFRASLNRCWVKPPVPVGLPFFPSATFFRFRAKKGNAHRPKHQDCRGKLFTSGTKKVYHYRMFLRTHRVGYTIYTEALEAFRDPVTRKPKHRCLARWPVDRSLAEAISDADKNASAWLSAAKSWAPRYGRSPSKDCQRALKAHQRSLALAATLRSVQARLNDQENASKATASQARLELHGNKSGSKRSRSQRSAGQRSKGKQIKAKRR
jgi:hypothetical protein